MIGSPSRPQQATHSSMPSLEAAQTCGAAALQQCMGADLSWKLILALLTLVSSSDETAPCQALTLQASGMLKPVLLSLRLW